MGEEKKLQVGKDLLTYAQASRQLAQAHLEQRDWSGLPSHTEYLTATMKGIEGYRHGGLND